MRPSTLFTERSRQWVLAAALVSVVATGVSFLFGQDLQDPKSRYIDSYSDAATGHRALAETLERLGFFVSRHRGPNPSAARAPMLFLEPDRLSISPESANRKSVPRLEDALKRRGEAGLVSVLVLPKWKTEDGIEVTLNTSEAESILSMAWSTTQGIESNELLNTAPELRHFAPDTTLWEEEFAGFGRGFQVVAAALTTFRSERPEAVLVGTPDRALVLERRLGRGRLLVISDADIAHSFNIHRGNHAALWITLLRDYLGTDTVVIDETFHGHVTQKSISRALGRLPLLPVTLHALLFLGLVVFSGSKRFGAALPIPPAYARGPQEAIRITASVFAAGRPVAHLAHTYVTRLLSDLTPATHPGQPSPDHAIDALAVRRGYPPQAVELRAHASAVHDYPKYAQREALRLAQRAFLFRQQFTVHRSKDSG